jgi:hypothetical protein
MKKLILFFSLVIAFTAISTIVVAQVSNALLKLVKDDYGIKVYDMHGKEIRSSQENIQFQQKNQQGNKIHLGQNKLNGGPGYFSLKGLSKVTTKQVNEETETTTDAAKKSSEPLPPEVAGWTTLFYENMDDLTNFFDNWTQYWKTTVGSSGRGYTWYVDTYRPLGGSGRSAWYADHQKMDFPDLPPPGPYANDMRGIITRGPFDFSDATGGKLKLWYWNDSEVGSDYLGWGVSSDGNAFYGDAHSGNSGGWQMAEIDLQIVPTLGDVTGQSQVWVGIWFQSNVSVKNEGAYVDNVLLQKFVADGAPNLTAHGQPASKNYNCPSLTMNVRVINDGTATAGATSTLGYYLSTDTDFTTADCRLGTDNVAALGVGATNDETITISDICSIGCVANGTYYLGYLIDETNAVAESNENDNILYFSQPINIECCDDCKINIDTPKGGDEWCENSTQTINWRSCNTSGNVKIFYTPNGGAWWTSITNSTPDDGTYEWTIPPLAQTSTQCVIRIYDRDNINCFGECRSYFTLRDECGCSITVDEPNGGETWNEGSTQDIVWHSSGTSGIVKIYYSHNGGNSWETIIGSTPDSGSYSWKLPEIDSHQQTDCRIKIEDAMDVNCCDNSDTDFTILGLPNLIFAPIGWGGPSYLHFDCPHLVFSKEILSVGQGPVGNFVSGIYLSADTNITITDPKLCTINIGPNAFNESPTYSIVIGLDDWEICCKACVKNVSYYVGAILDENNDVIESNEDDNVYYFTNSIVIDCCSDCRINIDTPSGGEDWCENTTQTIKWQPGSAIGNVKITYSPDGGVWWRTITNSTSDDGSYDWTIPPLSQTSTRCLIRVFDRTCYGESDNFFTLQDSCSRWITIDDPNGDESWNEGSTHDILWSSNGTSGNVRLRLSYNNGETWIDLINSTHDDGIWLWTLPAVNSTQTNCRIRIEDVADSSCNNMSNDKFTIIDVPTDIPPICTFAPASAAPDSEFWVEIEVGSAAQPVNELSAVAFELFYTNTQFVDYLTYEVGSFISNASATVQPDDAHGKVSVSVYRTDGGGNSGIGTVIRLKFKMLENAISGATVCYYMIDAEAQNRFGTQIPLAPCTNTCVEVSDLVVWPGDTDNDGDDDIFDILPIVSVNNWEVGGPIRPNASTDWIGQLCSAWTPKSATYCDCNGGGRVDIFDILTVVGPNYGKTHPMLTKLNKSNKPISNDHLNDPPICIEARDYENNTGNFWIDVVVGSSNQPVTDMKSIAFELTYTNTENINYDSYQIGAFLSGAQATVMPEDANGKISAAVYRLSGTGETGNGAILSIKFKADTGYNIDFDFPGVQAESSTGTSISLAPQGTSLVTNVVINDLQITNDFELIQNYPNPFNSETTIEYTVPNVSDVILTVFDINGHEIRKLVHEQKDAGNYSVMWNARDKNRKVVSSGVYFYQIEIRSRESEPQSFFDVKKMILMK